MPQVRAGCILIVFCGPVCYNLSIMNKQLTSKRFNFAFIFVLFAAVALLGGLLLSTPLSSPVRRWTGFADNIFTSVSALCVTGLSVKHPIEFSLFGQIIILILIQSGGLGLMTFATLIFVAIKRRITLKDRLAMQQSLGEDHNYDTRTLLKNIFLLTFAIEIIGWVLLMPPLITRLGGRGVFAALFLSVSAFCNAGLDVMGTTGLTEYSGSVLAVLSVSALVVLGGLGFSVISEFIRKRRFARLSLHSKIVLMASGVLIAVSLIFFAAAEWQNPGTLGGLPPAQRFHSLILMAVSPRTAGFVTSETAALTPASRFFTAVLMLIGASPASTGGGIKTTTMAVLFFMILSGIRGNDRAVLFRRHISYRTAIRAVTVMVFFLTAAVLYIIVMLAVESSLIASGAVTTESIIFETVAALTTTGMSLGATPLLSTAGKLIISTAMLLGRLGPLSIGIFIVSASGTESKITYPEGNIMIG